MSIRPYLSAMLAPSFRPIQIALCAGLFAACASQEPKSTTGSEQEAGLATTEQADQAANLGVWMKKPGGEPIFTPWETVHEFNALLAEHSKDSPLEVTFQPGTYELTGSISLINRDQIQFRGQGEVVLQLYPASDDLGTTTSPIAPGDTSFRVSHPERLHPMRRYQLFKPSGKHDRILQFIIYTLEGDLVTMPWGAHFMQHVESIPAKSLVVEHINIFEIKGNTDVTFENLTLDGNHRGEIRGHTTFCGIYAIGRDYEIGKRPTTGGLTIKDCKFVNLGGRGIAFYGIKDALVENCQFTNIRSEAVEIDHFSSGTVRGNLIDGAGVGIMINDAFESLVENNTIRNCKMAIRFLEVSPGDWVNTGNTAQGNRIGPGCKWGVRFDGEGLHSNVVRGNEFIGIEADKRVTNPEGNFVEL